MSKFLVPLQLFEINAPLVVGRPGYPDAGFISMYFRGGNLKQFTSSGVETDTVLDRLLDGFIAQTPSSIVATDSVLVAFQKIQGNLTALNATVISLQNQINAITVAQYSFGNVSDTFAGPGIVTVSFTDEAGVAKAFPSANWRAFGTLNCTYSDGTPSIIVPLNKTTTGFSFDALDSGSIEGLVFYLPIFM